MAASRPSGRDCQHLQQVRGPRCLDDRDDASFAGKKHRVVTEHVANRLHGIAYRYVSLCQGDAGTGGAAQLMTDGGESTAGRVAHEVQPLNSMAASVRGRTLAASDKQFAVQAELLARQHDRYTMVSDRPADKNDIARRRCRSSPSRWPLRIPTPVVAR